MQGGGGPAFAELLGESPAIEALRDTLRKLLGRQQSGRRLSSVLIQGETGTGKGLVARLIHRHGPRSSGPFVDVNCAAIPDTLLEAELFGFERGAFTDARRAKPGLFRTAHRGAIFLDEVGLLPEPLQAKLLTVIEERAVRRLGSTQSEPVDTWILSATNEDLQGAIRDRRFRQDLYHRLAVLTIRLPPLRERGHDVLLLADWVLGRVCADYGLPPKTLSDDARARLLRHPWPGNVRELSNVIERAALLTENPTVVADHLELGGTAAGPSPPAGGTAPPAPPAAPVSLGEAMRDHLRAALEQNGWNISRTASVLGISRNTLRARIERFGLSQAGAEGEPPTPGARPPLPGAPMRGARAESRPPPPLKTGAPGAAGTVRWERRRVTFLRASLVLDEADVDGADLSRLLEVMVDKVHAFGGRIEEMGQASVDASFGAEALEEAPRRAATAALALKRAVESAEARPRAFRGIALALHASQVSVGHVKGAPQIEQRDKRGAAVALDELIAGAPAGVVLLSAATVPLLERGFELVSSGQTGGAGAAYRLAGRSGSTLALWGRMSRFVGRKGELDLLRGRWAAAAAGHGQVLGIVGEPGVGKSRLLWEFIRSLESSNARVLEAGCVAAGAAALCLPVIELLRTYFHIGAEETPASARQRMRAHLEGLEPLLVPDLPALTALLLEVGVPDADWQAQDPRQRRRRTVEAVKRLLQRESRVQPLLLVVEDMHWADSETQAIVDGLVDGLPSAAILLVLTYRPEYQHAWGNRTFYAQIHVDPLPAENAEELLAALVGRHLSLEPLAPRLIEWTEGNPFFLEESVRTLAETGTLVGERGGYRLASPVARIQVPTTVEEVLAGRIARLAPERRRLLQCAAVVGKDVPRPILAAIADLSEDALADHLQGLQAAEFLCETESLPEVQYTFKHALTHDVAYASLSRSARGLHARILEAMEEYYAGRAGEHVDRLAHHAFHGQAWDKAVDYLRRAGQRSLERSANREAAAHFERALEVLGRLPPSAATDRQAVDVRIDLRNTSTLLGQWQRTLVHLKEAEALAERVGDRVRLGRVLSFQANCLFLLGDYAGAIEAGRRSIVIADALGDLALAAATKQYLGRSYHSMGDYRRAIELFGDVVASLAGERRHDHLGLPALPAVFSGSHLAACLAEIGDFDEATRQASDALRLAESVNHPDTQLWAHRGVAFVHLARGEAAAAEVALERALSLSRTGDLPTYIPRVSSELALARAMGGSPEAALPLIEDALEMAVSREQTANVPYIVRNLAEAQLLAGKLAEAAVSARRALDLFRRQGERGNEAHVMRLLAEVSWRREPATVTVPAELYGEARALASALGMRPLAARCELGLGLLWRGQGDEARALPHLDEAIARLRDLGMTRWLGDADNGRAGPGRPGSPHDTR